MADFRPSKIETRSKRYATELIHTVILAAEEATLSTLEIAEGNKQLWRDRFQELCKLSFQECVCVDGQDWNEDNDETTEFEPVDLEKKEFINGELTNHLHETVLEVALKRKHCPSKYKSCFSRLHVAEVGHLSRLKVTCTSNNESSLQPDNVLASEEVLDRLKDTSSTLSSLLKSSKSEVTRAENLKTVEKMYLKNKNASDMNIPNTPVKIGHNASPKKLRFSPRLQAIRKPRSRLKLC